MLANDMKQGQTGTHVNGWKFEITDNRYDEYRGIWLAKECGWNEIFSIYVHDIASVDMPDGSTEKVEVTPAQAEKISFRPSSSSQTYRLQTALIHRQQENWRGTRTIQFGKLG